MGQADLAAGQQRAVVLGHVDLARLATQRMDARVERAVAAAGGVHRQRAHHQRGFQHRLKAQQRMQRQRGAGLRAVDQRQPFLGPQHQRGDAGGGQRLGSRLALAIHPHLAFAEQGQRHVGQRRQIARGAHRALAGHVRAQAGVVHRHQGVDHHRAHTRIATRQAGRLQRQHQADDRRGQRRPHAHAVRADQVELQRGQVNCADAGGGQLAEARVDAVDRGLAFGRAPHHGGTGLDAAQRGRVDHQRLATGVDGLNFVERQLARAQQHQRPPPAAGAAATPVTIGRFKPCSWAQATASA